ncbi:MAG: copper(I)-binding protein [Alphaproteobacteria bacterium]|jgi:copper(I)-binding protein
MLQKFILFSLLFLMPALSYAEVSEKINLKKMWVRATIGQATTGVLYGILENKTGKDDALIAVSTPASRMSMIHRTSMNNEGIMSMSHMEKVVLKDDTYVAMEPGDIHVMLMGLEQKLTAGYEIPVKFEFENSPAQNIRVKIYPLSTKWKDVE